MSSFTANAIAGSSNLFTVEMIAGKLGVSAGTVRSRIASLKIKPVAKILTGRAGKPTLAFDYASVIRIARTLPRVIPLN